jgi:hypothetical protein
MRVFRCSIAFLLLLFAFPMVAAVAQKTDSPLICSATPTQSAYLVGEPIQLMIEISSAEKRPVEFTLDSVREHNEGIGCRTISESSGKVVASYDAVRKRGGLYFPNKTSLQPYQMSVVLQRRMLPRKAGKYRLALSIPIQYMNDKREHPDAVLTAECLVEITLSKQRALLEKAKAFRATRERPTFHSYLGVDYLLAFPDAISYPILNEMITGKDGTGWSQLIAQRLFGTDASEKSIVLLSGILHRAEREKDDSTRQQANHSLYRMYVEGSAATRLLIERNVGEKHTLRFRENLARGIPGILSYGE